MVTHEKEISRDVLINGGNIGLLNTLDLEFIRASEQLATEHIQTIGTLRNPFRITGHQLLRAAKKAPNGRAHAEVRCFIRKMAATMICATRQLTATKNKEVLFNIFETVVQEGDRRAPW